MTGKTEAKSVTQISLLDVARRKILETQSEEDSGNQRNQQKSLETAAKLKKTMEKSMQQYLAAQHTQEEKFTSTSIKSSSSEGIRIYLISISKYSVITSIAVKVVFLN